MFRSINAPSNILLFIFNSARPPHRELPQRGGNPRAKKAIGLVPSVALRELQATARTVGLNPGRQLLASTRKLPLLQAAYITDLPCRRGGHSRTLRVDRFAFRTAQLRVDRWVAACFDSHGDHTNGPQGNDDSG